MICRIVCRITVEIESASPLERQREERQRTSARTRRRWSPRRRPPPTRGRSGPGARAAGGSRCTASQRGRPARAPRQPAVALGADVEHLVREDREERHRAREERREEVEPHRPHHDRRAEDEAQALAQARAAPRGFPLRARPGPTSASDERLEDAEERDCVDEVDQARRAVSAEAPLRESGEAPWGRPDPGDQHASQRRPADQRGVEHGEIEREGGGQVLAGTRRGMSAWRAGLSKATAAAGSAFNPYRMQRLSCPVRVTPASASARPASWPA